MREPKRDCPECEGAGLVEHPFIPDEEMPCRSCQGHLCADCGAERGACDCDKCQACLGSKWICGWCGREAERGERCAHCQKVTEPCPKCVTWEA